MFSTKLRTTAQPSGFGLSSHGHTRVEVTWVTSARTAPVRPAVNAMDVAAGVRLCDVTGLGATSDLGLEPTNIPGISAWSPPSC